ncbi:unnamed protein product [Brugia pahangi]|uniref:Secreted protein n=1 Tax=Brugia pahangi TaxID=6280 RepID=A0A0N4TDX1_BRUPA|nr:unnamed protein product [Brugia pahangi]
MVVMDVMVYTFLLHHQAQIVVKNVHQVHQDHLVSRVQKENVANLDHLEKQENLESQIDLDHEDHQDFVENQDLLDRKDQRVIEVEY